MRVLLYGDVGPDVQLVQLALQRAGYANVDTDGEFGPDTLNTMRRFQASKGLSADGVVGPNTWDAIRPYLTGYVTRKIENGDTLWRLAQLYTTSVDAIKVANPGLQAENLNVGYTITIPLGFDVTPTTIDYTSELMAYVVDGLSARYPFISLATIGNSVMGKPIYRLKMGVGDTQVGYNASHHANEWINTPVLLKFLEQYAKAYVSGGTIFGRLASSLYTTSEVNMVAMVNPDGVDLVNGALTEGRYYENAKRIAERYPNVPFPSGWKANIEGTDLNLNYPAMWEEAKRIKFALGYTSPAPRDYVGETPLSAPESNAMYRLTLGNNYRLILAYHSQGKVIYWKFLGYEPPNSLEIAEKFGEVSGYAVETTPEESGYAGYKDWFIQQYNLPGYTIEVGRGVNPLPLSQFDEIYEDNLGILVSALQLSQLDLTEED